MHECDPNDLVFQLHADQIGGLAGIVVICSSSEHSAQLAA